MKKIALPILFVAALICPNKSNAQIAVIEAIGSTLLPGIVTGIKSIIDSSSRIRTTEEKATAKTDIDKVVKQNELEFVKKISPEIQNLSIIRSMYTLTRKANTAVGGLTTISNSGFISYVKLSDNIEMQREVAIAYTSDWAELSESLDKMKTTSIASLDPGLQQSLTIEKDKIERALGHLKTNSSFNSGNLSWTGSIGLTEAKGRMITIERSASDIRDIRTAIETIATAMDTRLDTYARSFQNLENALK